MRPKTLAKKTTGYARKPPTPELKKRSVELRGLAVTLIAMLVILIAWVAGSGAGDNRNQSPLTIANVPTQRQNLAGPPGPEPTYQPTIETLPTVVVIPTPTVFVWPSPVPITNTTVSSMASNSDVGLSQLTTIDRTEAISQLIWAPTGDKLLYLTMSGDLYWSNTDGTNSTLLHHYDEVRLQLEEQNPMTNTLLILDLGQPLPDGSRAPSHLDVINFTPGQPPTLQEGPDLPHPFVHLRWWSPTRASGIAHTGEDGGDLLVTVDQNGNLISELNVPYMIQGAVQPGGTWLAYSTTIQVDNPIDGTTPNTGYLLNLNTGQRLQVTQPGGGGVGNWSPDGNWFLSGTNLGISLVSADGHQWITIPDPNVGMDAVWSPDSKYLAYAVLQGQPSAGGDTIASWTGSVHVVNVPARQVTNLSPGSKAAVKVAKSADGSTLLMQPKWSRDSKEITFLSFVDSISNGSQLSPAIIHMALSTTK